MMDLAHVLVGLLLLGQTVGEEPSTRPAAQEGVTEEIPDQISDALPATNAESSIPPHSIEGATADRIISPPPAPGTNVTPPLDNAIVPPAPEPPDPTISDGPPRIETPAPPTGDLALSAADREPSAKEMVARFLAPPDAEAIEQQPMTLMLALSRTSDPASRLRVIRGYWRLTGALAEFNFRYAEVSEIGRIQHTASDARLVQQAQSAAANQLEIARLALVEAQYNLAELAGMTALGLPLPIDPPHLSEYSTHYERIAAGRPVQSRLAVIHQTLPGRLQAIKSHVTAVHAAQDAVDSLVDAYAEGRVSLWEVLASIEGWRTAKQAMMQSVHVYNDRIAEYAMAIVGPEITGRTLVSTLIEVSENASSAASSWEGSSARGVPDGIVSTRYDEPTMVPRSNTPTLAPPRPASDVAAAAVGPTESPVDRSPLPSGTTPAAEPLLEARAPTGSDRDEYGRRVIHSTFKHLIGQEGVARLGSRYADLAGADAADRLDRLTTMLCAVDLSGVGGTPISLNDCLRQAQGDRGEIIRVYWEAQQRLACLAVLESDMRMLGSLEPAVLKQSVAGQPEAMLQLRAAQSSLAARLASARVEATESQLALSDLVGQATQGLPAVPTTIPRCSSIELNAATAGAIQGGDWTARRTVALLPARAESLRARSATIVDGDELRVMIVNDYLQEIRPISDVLNRVSRQSQATAELLQSLAEYNQGVAEYVLRSQPTDTSTEELIARLGVR